ncbi:axin interactor, dorsalization-associated protein isoform X1 [Calypte anna]|nr:axin interactor, dorsalization-associated protein isoform X1 [Calypte anna]
MPPGSPSPPTPASRAQDAPRGARTLPPRARSPSPTHSRPGPSLPGSRRYVKHPPPQAAPAESRCYRPAETTASIPLPLTPLRWVVAQDDRRQPQGSGLPPGQAEARPVRSPPPISKASTKRGTVSAQQLRIHRRSKVLKNILTYNKEFPFDVQPVPLRKILAPGEEEHLEFEEDDEEGGAGAGSPDSFPARVPGTLLPRLPSEPGMTLLTINIEKIGLKDAGQCIDPYITVSVKDLNGIDLTPVQDTPVALRKEDTYVHFNVDIEIQKHVEKLTKGAAIFFEFKHYKPKKRFTSTKCFAFMEMDEIKAGAIVIELYKKPTDFKRKKLQLLTKKPLYLHLHQTLHKE